jgi:hypothetical protein
MNILSGGSSIYILVYIEREEFKYLLGIALVSFWSICFDHLFLISIH